MVKGDEDKLAEILYKKINDSLIKEIKAYNLKIDKKIQIQKDFTYIPSKRKFCLGGAEVDLVIYQELKKNHSYHELKAGDLCYTAQLNDEVRIPLVVLELKSGHITSDAIRARDLVARDIRNIFPFVSYIFIGENSGKKDETLFRQGKNFTNFIIDKGKLSEENQEKLLELIKINIKLLKLNKLLENN